MYHSYNTLSLWSGGVEEWSGGGGGGGERLPRHAAHGLDETALLQDLECFGESVLRDVGLDLDVSATTRHDTTRQNIKYKI